ncbi:MAG: HD domain-containing protein [Candidatus Zipacnadales bacterium]
MEINEAGMNEAATTDRQQYAKLEGQQLAVARAAAFAKLCRDCRPVMAQYVTAVDDALRRIFRWCLHQASEQVGQRSYEAPWRLAVAAVGGYGRQRLAPYSDIDVAVVVPDEQDEVTQVAIRHAYVIVNDALRRGLGIEYGYAYYVLEDGFELDERTLSALLDARLVVGSQELLHGLNNEVFRQLEGPLFLRWNRATRQQARQVAGEVVHLQEPNLKESPGGLRDLQCALWSAASVWRRRPAEVLNHLVAIGAIPVALAAAAEEAHDFIWSLRSHLHLAAGRKRDVLGLDAYEPLARAMGYSDPFGEADSSALMAEYYAHAERLERISRRIFDLCEAARLSVGDGYYVKGRWLLTRNAPRLKQSAETLLNAFRLGMKYRVELSPQLVASIEAATETIRRQRDCPKVAHHFLELLQYGPSAFRLLRAMAETGILQALIPEFAQAMQTGSGDPLHRFTVGEHLLRTVEKLDVLAEGAAEELEHHARVYSELDKPELLVLAALLHDVGRITPQQDHCEVGADIARRIAHHLGMAEEDADTVAQLIRKHLILERVATLRDISDEATLHHVAEEVDSLDFFRRLYLLTCADIMAVGPGLWTDVRRAQLEDLYYRVLAHLVEEAPARASAQDLQKLRERALETLLAGGKLPPEAVSRHCREMPDSYILSTPIPMMGVHISLIQQIGNPEPTVIDVYNAERSKYTEITVCRHDDALPGLFSRLCAALYANEADIHDASIYTSLGEHAIVVDTLWVSWRGGQIPEERAEAIARDLREVLDHGIHPETLLERKGRPRPKSLKIEWVHQHNDWSHRHTVFEVCGRDQLGFLYCVTAALASLGLNINTAKITTRGTIARDAFYVSNVEGKKLSDEEAAEASQRLSALLTETREDGM